MIELHREFHLHRRAVHLGLTRRPLPSALAHAARHLVHKLPGVAIHRLQGARHIAGVTANEPCGTTLLTEALPASLLAERAHLAQSAGAQPARATGAESRTGPAAETAPG